MFYELGLAHAYVKPVILITSDDIHDAPSDVRHLDFIRYSLGSHVEFLERLDGALRNVFSKLYDSLYETAEQVYREFSRATSSRLPMASREIFVARVMDAERKGELPAPDDVRLTTQFVLPKIISGVEDATVMRQITEWLEQQASG